MNTEVIYKKEHYAHLEHCDNQFNAVIEVVNELVKHAAGHKLGPINDWIGKWANEDNWTVDWHKILVEKGVDQTNLSQSKIAALLEENRRLKEENDDLSAWKEAAMHSHARWDELCDFVRGLIEINKNTQLLLNDMIRRSVEKDEQVRVLREALEKIVNSAPLQSLIGSGSDFDQGFDTSLDIIKEIAKAALIAKAQNK